MLPTKVLTDVIKMIPYNLMPALSTVSSNFNNIICSCVSKEDLVFASLYSQISNEQPCNSVIMMLCKNTYWKAFRLNALDRLMKAMSFDQLFDAYSQCYAPTYKYVKQMIKKQMLQEMQGSTHWDSQIKIVQTKIKK